GETGDVLDLADALRARLPRRGGVQGVDVGEQDQRVRAEKLRDERGEAVVVPEADLVRGGGVVLVDHGDGAQVQQRLERGAHVAVGRPPDDIGFGEQHLPRDQAVPGEGSLPGGGQQRLAHARRGLLQLDGGGPLGQAQRAEGRGDRTGGDDHQLGAAPGEGRGGVRDLPDPLLVEASALVGEARGADLHHQAACRGQGVTGGQPLGLAEFCDAHRVAPSDGSLQWPALRSASIAAIRSMRAAVRALCCSFFASRVGRWRSSSRSSVPRRPSSSAPPTIVGSQSKTTASSPGPMSTVDPATAPEAYSWSSTPSFARRSARKPTASSLVKSVWCTQRSGLSPCTRKAVPPSYCSVTTRKPFSSTARGASTIGAGSGSGSAARACSTRSPSTNDSSRRPLWETAETSTIGTCRSASWSRIMSAMSAPSGRSVLFSTMTVGRSMSG